MRNSKGLKVLTLALVLCMGIALVAGCGGSAGTGGDTAAGNSSEASVTESSAPAYSAPTDSAPADSTPKISGEISYSAMWTEKENQAVWLSAMADAFQQETGVKVNLTYVGRDILTKVRTDLLAGKAPDLVDQEFSPLYANFLASGDPLCLSLTDFLNSEKGPEGQEKLADVFPATMLNLYAKDGQVYLYPYELITSGFHYDKNLFKENGVEAPKTWEEFIKVGETLKAKGIAPLVEDGNINFYNAYYFYWAMQSIAGPGAFYKAAGDKTGAAWDQPEYLQAAQLVYDLSASGKDFFQKGYAGSQYPSGENTVWAQGKAGSILCGSWIPDECGKAVKEGFEFGFYPFPSVEGGKGPTSDIEGNLIGCAIPAKAKNPDAAKQFLKFLTKKENAQKFADDTHNISARTDVELPAMLSQLKDFMANAQSYHKPYDGVQADYPAWIKEVFYPLDDKLVFGTLKPEDFIKEIKAKSIDFWAKQK
jgi:raffinose/stachyose/melibiose transport system substrate-binding protein